MGRPPYGGTVSGARGAQIGSTFTRQVSAARQQAGLISQQAAEQIRLEAKRQGEATAWSIREWATRRLRRELEVGRELERERELEFVTAERKLYRKQLFGVAWESAQKPGILWAEVPFTKRKARQIAVEAAPQERRAVARQIPQISAQRREFYESLARRQAEVRKVRTIEAPVKQQQQVRGQEQILREYKKLLQAQGLKTPKQRQLKKEAKQWGETGVLTRSQRQRQQQQVQVQAPAEAQGEGVPRISRLESQRLQREAGRRAAGQRAGKQRTTPSDVRQQRHFEREFTHFEKKIFRPQRQEQRQEQPTKQPSRADQERAKKLVEATITGLAVRETVRSNRSGLQLKNVSEFYDTASHAKQRRRKNVNYAQSKLRIPAFKIY